MKWRVVFLPQPPGTIRAWVEVVRADGYVRVVGLLVFDSDEWTAFQTLSPDVEIRAEGSA
jgi:hypothetical protein